MTNVTHSFFYVFIYIFNSLHVSSLGIFSLVPPTEPCALKSTQPLKVSTTDFSWGKGGRYFWLTTYHPCSAETSRKSGALSYPELLGPPRPVAGDLYFTLLYFTLLYFTLLYFTLLYFTRFEHTVLIIRRDKLCSVLRRLPTPVSGSVVSTD